MLQSATSNSTGTLVYGYGGQSANQIQPQPYYALTSPSRELAPGYAVPDMTSGACPVVLVSYVFLEPSGGVSSAASKPSSRANFDVKAYAANAGLGDPIGSHVMIVSNGEPASACFR